MKKRTKNVIKGILIPIAVILSLLIAVGGFYWTKLDLSLIHISEPTRP